MATLIAVGIALAAGVAALAAALGAVSVLWLLDRLTEEDDEE